MRESLCSGLRGRTSVLDGRLPELGREGGGVGKWVGPGREKSQPFELPKQHPLWPQETVPKCHCLRPGQGEGEVAQHQSLLR